MIKDFLSIFLIVCVFIAIVSVVFGIFITIGKWIILSLGALAALIYLIILGAIIYAIYAVFFL